jgi:hypothetical protein
MNVLDLQRNEMFKPVASMAAAAAIAGLFVFATSVATLPQAALTGDRHVLTVKGTACSQRGWPDFERSCQFDLRQPAEEVRTVRVLDLR